MSPQNLPRDAGILPTTPEPQPETPKFPQTPPDLPIPLLPCSSSGEEETGKAKAPKEEEEGPKGGVEEGVGTLLLVSEGILGGFLGSRILRIPPNQGIDEASESSEESEEEKAEEKEEEEEGKATPTPQEKKKKRGTTSPPQQFPPAGIGGKPPGIHVYDIINPQRAAMSRRHRRRATSTARRPRRCSWR